MISPLRLLFAAILFPVAGGLFGAETVMLPTGDNVGVYKNEVRRLFESPLFTVSTNDRLLVIENKGDRCLVQDPEGRKGWVDTKLCVPAPRGSRLSGFNPAVVTADWGAHGFGLVTGDSPSPDDTIVLSRSFSRELRVNMDQEEAQRATSF